jgi:hypothetical protein
MPLLFSYGSLQLEIVDDELSGVDAYEASFSYTRVASRLASGKEAWVYVHSV